MAEQVEDQVRNVLAEWCQRLDDGDVDGMVALFTEDGTYTVTALDRSITGRPAIEEFLHSVRRAGNADVTSKHLFGNPEIHADDDSAWVSSDTFRVQRDASGSILAVAGRSVDRLVKVGDSWLFAERVSLSGGAKPVRDPAAEARAARRGRVAEEGIRLRLAQYNHSLRDGRLDDLVDCWTSDGVFTALGTSYQGRDAIRELLTVPTRREGQQRIGGGHVVANTIMDVDGDRAHAETDLFTIALDGDRWVLRGSVGRYVDDLVNEGDAWRFASRTNVTEQW
jgi:ketosteroid isomerase-like protein